MVAGAPHGSALPGAAGSSVALVPSTDLNRPRLADDVASVLREMIFTGELAPGTRLLQIQLASQLGVSRTPLRANAWCDRTCVLW